MRKIVFAGLMIAGLSTAAIAAHNPTPPEGYKNYGQCRSALAMEQNDVRMNPEEYTEAMAEDINTATCEEDDEGAFRILFS